MSAVLNPVPKPSPVQPQSPVPVQPQGPRRSPWLWGLLLVAIVAGSWAAYQALRPAEPSPSAKLSAIPTLTVKSGTLRQSIRIAGETGAVDFANVVAPNLTGPDSGRDLTIIRMAESGDRVKQNGLLAVIDGQALKDHVEEVHSTVLQSEADVKKREAEQSIERESLAQTIRQAKAEWDKLRLEAQAAEVRTDVDRQLLQLAVEEAEAQYKQLLADQRVYENLHSAEKRILQLTTHRHERHRDRHASDYEKFQVFSPMTGMAVRQQIRRGMELAQVREGDQISPRQTFMKIVDTSKMQLDGFVNQTQSSHLKVGQRARVGLDAFPDVEFDGELYSIGALATAGSMSNDYIRRLPVRVRIFGEHPQLIPSMSGWADIVLAEDDGKPIVPLSAVFNEGGKQVVYVKKGGKFERREVELGMQNNTHAVAVSGLSDGDEVAQRRPDATT